METNNVGLHRIHVYSEQGRLTAEQTWKSRKEMINTQIPHQFKRKLDNNKSDMRSFIHCVWKYWKAGESAQVKVQYLPKT